MCTISNEQLIEELNSKGITDFDFLIGNWKVRHRKLRDWSAEQEEWFEFGGLSSTQKILGSYGNLEQYVLHLPEKSYHAIAIRSFDEAAQLWSIWWLDSRFPTSIDVPVIGSFKDNTGVFIADDVIQGIALKVRFTWIASNPLQPRWEQAFSVDAGMSWKTNWTMQFYPAD